MKIIHSCIQWFLGKLRNKGFGVFSSFFDVFPELMHSECRNIFIIENNGFKYIPPGNYALLETFCSDIACDCRKVIIQVVTADPHKIWAILNYGWESEKYYKTWWGESYSLYKPMSGISFDSPTKDPLKQEFFEIFQELIQSDKKYAKRIESHYFMFKEAIQKKKSDHLEKKSVTSEKMARNNLCRCNSGKKFKKCCLLI